MVYLKCVCSKWKILGWHATKYGCLCTCTVHVQCVSYMYCCCITYPKSQVKVAWLITNMYRFIHAMLHHRYYILNLMFGNVMVTLIIGSQILKAFCAVFGICARKNFIQRIFRWIQLQTAPSRDAWSMAEMLWQSVHEYLFIYLYIKSNVCSI